MGVGVFTPKSFMVQAAQFTGDDPDGLEVATWCDGRVEADDVGVRLSLPTPYGVMSARPGDWIFRGPQGSFFPWKPALFAIAFNAVTPPDPLPDPPLRVRELATGRVGTSLVWGDIQAWVRWDDGSDGIYPQAALEVLGGGE